MQVTFTKTAQGCRTRCERADRSIEEWDSPDAAGIPHDLMHWIVEAHLALEESFYGHIRNGLDHHRVNELAHSNSELASTELLVLLIQNEAAMRRGELHADPEAVRGLYGLHYPEYCSSADKESLINTLESATQAWRDLRIGNSWLRYF